LGLLATRTSKPSIGFPPCRPLEGAIRAAPFRSQKRALRRSNLSWSYICTETTSSGDLRVSVCSTASGSRSILSCPWPTPSSPPPTASLSRPRPAPLRMVETMSVPKRLALESLRVEMPALARRQCRRQRSPQERPRRQQRREYDSSVQSPWYRWRHHVLSLRTTAAGKKTPTSVVQPGSWTGRRGGLPTV
jgi:hypothetical protein